jgi:hypothetical protein
MAESLLEAWCRGFVARRDALAASANPHSTGSEVADTWNDGWHAGGHRQDQLTGSDVSGADLWDALVLSGDPVRFH